MLLALADHLDTNWDTVWWIVGAFFLLTIVPWLILGFRRRSLRTAVWGGVGCLVCASLLLVVWQYFGWATLHTDTGWHIRRHRALGRVTVLAYDTNGDWWADGKAVYNWSNPWDEKRPYSPHYIVEMVDKNLDGQWDTWWRPLGQTRDGKPLTQLEADTDLDGRPDYRTTTVFGEPSSSYDEVKRRRGF